MQYTYLFIDILVKAHYGLCCLPSFLWQSSQYFADGSGFVLKIDPRKGSILIPMLEMEKLRQGRRMTCSRSCGGSVGGEIPSAKERINPDYSKHGR